MGMCELGDFNLTSGSLEWLLAILLLGFDRIGATSEGFPH